MSEPFDAFCCFNKKDEDDALALTHALEVRGVRVWFSNRDVLPGTPFPLEIKQALRTVSAAVVLLGRNGLGDWQQTEVAACFNEATRRKMRLIPVLLPGGPAVMELDPLLAIYACVDLRGGVGDETGLKALIWGIQGQRNALETTRILMAEAVAARTLQPNQRLDAWGMAAVKSRLHAASEVLAQVAADNAARAAAEYPEDLLTTLIPLVVDLRWNRGYASGLVRLLKIPQTTKRLSDFELIEASPPCPVHEGVLSAERQPDGRVLVRLDGQPAAVVSGFEDTMADAVLAAVNGHGRLGVPAVGGLSLRDRIGEVPLHDWGPAVDEKAAALFRNREALIPLVARLGMPGEEWLLPGDTEVQPTGELLLTDLLREERTPAAESTGPEEVVEEIYFAGRAIRTRARRRAISNELRELLKSDTARLLLGDIVDKDPEEALKRLESFMPRKSS